MSGISTPLRLLVLTQAQQPDTTADVVIGKIRQRGGEVVVFDPADFPANASLTAEFADGSLGLRIHTTLNASFDLRSIDAVWVRRPGDPAQNMAHGGDITDFIQKECQRFAEDFWALVDCPWIPSRPAQLAAADLRISQLLAAAAVGLSTPATLATTAVSDFVSFYQRNGGAVISKLAAQMLDYSRWMRYTDPITPTDLIGVSSVAYAPILLQELISKSTELRITVVGSKVFTAEISAQKSHRSQTDWRRYDYSQTEYRKYELPDDVSDACVNLTKRLGLSFSAIDMIVTEDSRYIFIELNPTGQWYWIEELTGLPISDALCDLLFWSNTDQHNGDD